MILEEWIVICSYLLQLAARITGPNQSWRWRANGRPPGSLLRSLWVPQQHSEWRQNPNN